MDYCGVHGNSEVDVRRWFVRRPRFETRVYGSTGQRFASTIFVNHYFCESVSKN